MCESKIYPSLTEKNRLLHFSTVQTSCFSKHVLLYYSYYVSQVLIH